VNLLAMLVSLVVLPVVSSHYTLTCVLFALLTCLHIFANYSAVRAVRMESLNQARLTSIVQHYLKSGQVNLCFVFKENVYVGVRVGPTHRPVNDVCAGCGFDPSSRH
jgi:hypothetical protein